MISVAEKIQKYYNYLETNLKASLFVLSRDWYG